MKINKFDLITLSDNNKYVVGAIIPVNNTDYYLLCNEENPKLYMYCYLKDEKLVKVVDEKLFQLLSLKTTKDLFQ